MLSLKKRTGGEEKEKEMAQGKTISKIEKSQT